MEIDTRRCMRCSCPNCDHSIEGACAMRYPLKAAVRHYLLEKARVIFGRCEVTGHDFH